MSLCIVLLEDTSFIRWYNGILLYGTLLLNIHHSIIFSEVLRFQTSLPSAFRSVLYFFAFVFCIVLYSFLWFK